MQPHSKLLAALSAGQTVVFNTPAVTEEILSEREQMFYRCSTDACAACETLRGGGCVTAFRQARLGFHVFAGYQ